MFVPGQNQLLANLSLLLFLRIFRSFVFMILKRTFEECVSLFSYQRSFFALPFVSNSFAIISCCFLLVKKFFQLFSKLFLTFRLISANFDSLSQLTLYCQELFSFLFSTVFVSCNSDIIAFISVFVNYLFTFFYIFFYMLLTLSFLFQKTNCISDVLHRNQGDFCFLSYTFHACCRKDYCGKAQFFCFQYTLFRHADGADLTA